MDFNNWNKETHIGLPKVNKNWSKNYMQTPVPYIFQDKLLVFYGTRDSKNISSISWIELDPDSFSIKKTANKPLLTKGSLGSFDDSGVIPSSIIRIKNKYFLYYMGWSKGGDVASRNAGGVAELNFNKMCAERVFEGPILDRTREEPQYCAVPRVYRINSKYIMYYLGVNKWIGDYKSNDAIYEIRIATSNDGMNWKRNGTKALSLKNNEGGHYPFSVLKVENKYIGFYSSRNKTSYRKNPKNAYKIFFAESEDGIHWKEKNKIKIKNLNNSFENVMQAYPSVLKINGEHVMFYNGNDFGKYGIEVCKKVI